MSLLLCLLILHVPDQRTAPVRPKPFDIQATLRTRQEFEALSSTILNFILQLHTRWQWSRIIVWCSVGRSRRKPTLGQNSTSTASTNKHPWICEQCSCPVQLYGKDERSDCIVCSTAMYSSSLATQIIRRKAKARTNHPSSRRRHATWVSLDVKSVPVSPLPHPPFDTTIGSHRNGVGE